MKKILKIAACVSITGLALYGLAKLLDRRREKAF